MVYHYQSQTTTTTDQDGNIQSSSSVIVRELDDGEVGILMAGNNSILDPTLTPRMLASPTNNYDVESDALPPSPDDNYDTSDGNTSVDEEETWFPALRHNSWIHGLDDDDDELDGGDMVGKMMETLFATDVLEKEDDDDDDSKPESKNDGRRPARYAHRPHKSRRTTGSTTKDDQRPTSDRISDDEEYDDDDVDSLVPVDIICVVLND